MNGRFHIDKNDIRTFCMKWKVIEFALFGSALRDDFRPDSDVDVLVSFEPEAKWSYWDWPDMQDELKALFDHEVDMVEKEALKNPIRRQAILSSREIIYAKPQG